MFFYHKLLVAILSLSFLSSVSYAGERGWQHYQEAKARAAQEAAQRAADQRARDENWRRIQAQQRAQQQQKK